MAYMPSNLLLLQEDITTAVTAFTTTPVIGFAKAKSLEIQCDFTYGSGGTTVKVWVQTSFDAGTTWVDIANFAHTTASLRRLYNLSALTPVTTVYTATDGTLADNTAKDGLIGDQLRVKMTTTGTYAGGTIIFVNACAKD